MAMTIAEELRDFAAWLSREGELWQDFFAKQGLCSNAGQAYAAKAEYLRSLAAKVDGRVLVKPELFYGDDDPYRYAWIGHAKFLLQGVCDEDRPDEDEVAIANLQALLDKEG